MWQAIANIGMGLFSANRAKKEAEERRRYAEEQRDLAYERSLPWSSYGPAGNVEFDSETKEMIQTLNPEYQAMMQGFLGSSSMANQELQNMMGDPNKLAQEQFKMFEEFNKDAFAQQRLQGQEAAIAQGRTGTQGYYDQMAIEDSIGRDRMRGQMAAIGTGMDYRNMLRAEALGFGADARATAGMLRGQADQGIAIGQGSNVTANTQGVREAANNLTKANNAYTAGLVDQFSEYDFDAIGNKIQQGYSMFTDAARTNAIRNGTGFSDAQDTARRGMLFPK